MLPVRTAVSTAGSGFLCFGDLAAPALWDRAHAPGQLQVTDKGKELQWQCSSCPLLVMFVEFFMSCAMMSLAETRRSGRGGSEGPCGHS